MGLGEDAGVTIVESAMLSPNLGRCEVLVPAIVAYRSGEPLVASREYWRYWHGYTIVTRPSLSLLGVAGTRALSLMLALGAMTAAAVVIGRATSPLAALALMAPYFLTSDLVDIGESAPHAVGFGAIWVGVLIAWFGIDRRASWDRIIGIGWLTGSVTAFVDLLVQVPGTMTLISTVIVVSLWRQGWRRLKLLGGGVAGSFSWFAGFALTWSAKWVLAGLFLGPAAAFQDVAAQLSFRVAGENSAVVAGFGHGAGANLAHWLDRPLGFLVPVGMALAVFLIIRILREAAADFIYILTVTGLALIPLVWYEVLSNHSQIHFWITYRSLPLALGALLFALTAPLTQREATQIEISTEPPIEFQAV
jgi:hypothetical protein